MSPSPPLDSGNGYAEGNRVKKGQVRTGHVRTGQAHLGQGKSV